MTGAPDYCEPVVGWRSWRAVRGNGEIYLTSIFHRTRWPWGEPLAGTCETWRLPWRRRKQHPVPADDCLCGIYAATFNIACTYAPLLPSRMREGYAVVGTVALWGEVAEHIHGWRASLAYPRELYLVSPRVDADAAEVAEWLERYDVPVTAVRAGRRRDVVTALRPAA